MDFHRSGGNLLLLMILLFFVFNFPKLYFDERVSQGADEWSLVVGIPFHVNMDTKQHSTVCLYGEVCIWSRGLVLAMVSGR
jgi:hypothetical protein